MSALLHDVATAALPVAVVLLALAAAALLVRWGQIEDAEAQRIAARYAEPLRTWCLVAVAVHAVALVTAGDVAALSLALALGLGAGAVLLRPGPPATAPAPAAAPAVDPDDDPMPAAAAAATPAAAAPEATPADSLWARPAHADALPRAGLWGR